MYGFTTTLTGITFDQAIDKTTLNHPLASLRENANALTARTPLV